MGDWPITVFMTRYGGVYEGGTWAAIRCEPQDVPADALGDDVSAMRWWEENRQHVGVGDGPASALLRLLELPRHEYGRWAR